MHFKKQAQIGALLFDKALTEVSAKYSNYSNVFSAENAVELIENTRINEYIIKLKEDKQPLFGLIYSLEPVELEIFKIYIKTNLANSFIWPSKSPAGAFIFFDKKSDRNFHLCINYWSLNNITIKNQYLLPLISMSLDWLGWIKRCT